MRETEREGEREHSGLEREHRVADTTFSGYYGLFSIHSDWIPLKATTYLWVKFSL